MGLSVCIIVLEFSAIYVGRTLVSLSPATAAVSTFALSFSLHSVYTLSPTALF